MASKNPLEEVRSHILQCRQLGIEDEFSELKISEEVFKISDALDRYYGINRSNERTSSPGNPGLEKSDLITVFDEYYKNHGHLWSMSQSRQNETREYFQQTKRLLSSVKEPLTSIKNKRSSQDTFYLSLSSTIVSIAIRDVVSEVNSYQKPSPSNITRYHPMTGVDMLYSKLIIRALEVIDILYHFDMTPECKENYEANRKSLQTIKDYIIKTENAALQRRSKQSSSGCLVFLLVASTSLFVCFGGLLMFLK